MQGMGEGCNSSPPTHIIHPEHFETSICLFVRIFFRASEWSHCDFYANITVLTTWAIIMLPQIDYYECSTASLAHFYQNLEKKVDNLAMKIQPLHEIVPVGCRQKVINTLNKLK